MQEERWRGGERKGSAWVSRDNVIAEDEEDEDSEEEDDKSDYSEAAVAERPATTVVDDASPTDRLQVWRCRRQGRWRSRGSRHCSSSGRGAPGRGGGGDMGVAGREARRRLGGRQRHLTAAAAAFPLLCRRVWQTVSLNDRRGPIL